MQSVNGPFLVCIMFFRYFSAVFIKIITRAKLSSIAGVIVLFCFINVFAAIAADNPKVLVLHSYHSGYEWTDSINSAIIKSLHSAYPEGDVFVEYMNTKRVALEVMSPMLRRNYAILYRNAGLNVIIATDNNALDFLLKYGEELFPGVPVVFCGINNFDDYNLSNYRNYTGVREDLDIGATLDIALRFHPDTHTVAMIADVGETAQINLAIAREVAKKYGNIRFVELSGLSETALATKLGQLGSGTIILQLSYYRTPEGRVFSVKESMQLIQKHTQLPVYALWDFYMLPPAIGGKIVTGTLQGKAAAEIAIRILKGEKPEAIPPYSCPTTYYFNYDALQKYNIPASLIPADSIIAGKPDTLYSRFKTYIQIGAAFGLSLIVTILILLRSIVLQHRNEAALRASEEKFRVLFENAIEGIFQTSLDGRLLNANPAMAHILAFASPDELKARLTNVWQLYLYPEERDLFLSSILQHGTVRGLELQFRHKDKQTIWVSINARLVRDDAGAPLLVEGFLSDISDRKLAEENIRKLNEELEQRVRDRTALLQRKTEELEQANESLKEVDRLKSMFIASMSHELRTPLNSIIGFSSVLLDEWVGPVSAEQKQNLATILNSGRHLLNMINDILDATHIESGTIKPVIDEFDLYDLLTQAESEVAAAIREKGLELRSELLRQRMRTDRRRLLQCVLNILSNAAKFTDEGSVTLEARIVSSPGETPEVELVEIAVTDTGIGIGEEDLSRIFQPFYRIVTPARAIVPGTGLGLFLTRKIATEILKGNILVSSEYGKGSRFALTIPVRLP